MADSSNALAALLQSHRDAILKEWITFQQRDLSLRNSLLKAGELEQQCADFLNALVEALRTDPAGDVQTSQSWTAVRDLLATISRSRARQGFTTTETATFVFSLKQAIFSLLRREMGSDPARLIDAIWQVSQMIDRLGLYTADTYQKGREDIISRQQQELMELSTPVVRLWDGVLALPLIGTLDSARTQVVMESLLQAVVDTESSIAIIDITGVPVVDTLVAQHLLKTVAAARLMGADCIISGIRPQIAQTIIHLGVDITAVVTKATLADAFKLALTRLDLAVYRRRDVPSARPAAEERG